jgi:hypothetical protein
VIWGKCIFGNFGIPQNLYVLLQDFRCDLASGCAFDVPFIITNHPLGEFPNFHHHWFCSMMLEAEWWFAKYSYVSSPWTREVTVG